MEDFMCVHRPNNVIKILDRVCDHEKNKTAKTLMLEAKIRRDNPVYGSPAVADRLKAVINARQKELDFVQNQVSSWKKVTEIQKQKEQLEAQLDKYPLSVLYPALEENLGNESVSYDWYPSVLVNMST